MAFGKEQQEPNLPSSNVSKRETADLLPKYYRTSGNRKFLQATLDQIVQPGTVKKINGYIGRQSAKAVTSKDIFLAASDNDRQNYQLEPAAVIEDYLGNTTFFKDYIDHINHIETFDGNVKNHSRLNREEFYSWNPHICWDKFVNYQQYYWLPLGPDPIEIFGQQKEIQSTYTVQGVDEEDNTAYLFTPNGLTRNPTLRLFRGHTYVFDISAPGNPFSIKTIRTSGNLDRYNAGVSANAVEQGQITFTVPVNAPDVLFYVSETNTDTGGVFHILDVEENTFLDLDSDILGKKTYTISSGLSLSNGMKLKFSGQVTPEKYSQGFWYVEGVGTAIRLISEKELEVRSTYVDEISLLFDDLPFDNLPFSETGTYPGSKDYITINRASLDNNPWSRYNRWFHQDVIMASAAANGTIASLDQSARATRPIIEFNANIKLHNYGIKSKPQIDLIDNITTDVFSIVEGSLGYYVDGVALADGMRVIFNADTDSMVKNKTWKVNFITINPTNRQETFNAETQVDSSLDRISFTTIHGFSLGTKVSYINNDNPNVPGLVHRQIYYVKPIDPYTIELYTNPELTYKVDLFNISTGTHSFEVFLGQRKQIHLTEELDFEANLYDVVAVRYGQQQVLIKDQLIGNQGQSYWFNGTDWKLAQIKKTINQPPLFDVFDEQGISYSDATKYEGSNFSGNKIFSYRVGNSGNDSVLGFPLTYQNINNIGDIVFDFNLLTESFSYKNVTDVLTKRTDIGYLKISDDIDRHHFENAWLKAKITDSQPVVRIFKESGLVNNFPIDVYDNKDELEDLEVRVYVNGKRLAKNSYTIQTGVVRKFVVLNTNVLETDVVTLKCFSKQEKNSNGHYELPNNLQNNPLNVNLEKFTLGEVIDHVDSIVDNINNFSGIYPGNGNLRDLGDLTSYGTKFVQHSGPAILSLYHLGSKSANIVKALDQARKDYGVFKRAFIVAAIESGIDTDAKRHVDFVLQQVFKDKPKSSPYYLSDMFGYTAANRLEYTVLDSRIKIYPLTDQFNLKSLSNKAVGVYLNGEQLVHGKDYQFGDDVFFEILTDLQEDDLIEVYEYQTTDGCFVPPTPTKLGLYPKFEPKKYVDDTYLEPVEVIQGHDGSITIAYGDYRDDLILELEKRIYNNIKVEYNPEIFDIFNFVPGYERSTPYSLKEFNQVLSKYFYQWTSNIQQDYTKHDFYDRLNSFTFNYRGFYTADGTPVPAAWRGIYQWLLDTDRPHTHPWEILGFTIEPKWWQTVYGPAPYTSDNLIMWDDIKQGIVREPGRPLKVNSKFVKNILSQGLPVDDQGNLVSPLDSGLIQGTIPFNNAGYFEFGDQSPVETAWRRSSYFAFSLIETLLLLAPNYVLGRGLDRSRIVKNLTDQLVYSETGLRISPKDVLLPSTVKSSTRTYTAGLINYVVDYLTSDNLTRIDQYQSDLKFITVKISTRLGAFTNQPKYKILLDSKSPNASGGVFVPEENYKIDLNVSSAIRKVNYSGIVITKFADGFELTGYNFDNPYFLIYTAQQDDRVIRVGGVSESYILWDSGKFYVAGKIIQYGNAFYRVKVNHTTTDNFDESLYARLNELPVIGGREAVLRKNWNKNFTKVVSYGTKFSTIQEVVDVIQGHGAYLEDQGFVFDDFDAALTDIANWETSVKEFLFWTTQNWAEGAVISLSPAANRLVFNSSNAVVEDITDQFYGYSVFRVDGQKLDPEFISVYRSGNKFVLQPEDTAYGVYGVSLYLVQKEHIAILDDTTLFNDTIYDKPAGYRQDRVKILGYVTSEWNGGFEIPGFVYDRAVIKSWEPYTDYYLGDIVKHKEFYYSAKSFLVGTEEFESFNWVLLDSKPEPQLLPNLDYKAEQFTDFYDLDTDNLDVKQQKIAQHLIGYQKRQYLENIINNDVSQYKFYQGMIIEKGTQNVLNKLFDVLSADDQESLTFDEEWAFRVGEYGALDTFKEVEFVLDESKFNLKPQPLELTDRIDSSISDFIYRQTPNDVYIKPLDYTSNLWPTKQSKDFLRTAGYVSKADVKVNVDTLDNLTDITISNFKEGDYIWTAFETPPYYWNIYRLTSAVYKVENVTYNNSVVTVTTNKTPKGLKVGDIIRFEVVDNDPNNTNKNNLLVGFHKITLILPNGFKFNKTLSGFETFDTELGILLYNIVPFRFSNVDDVNDSLPKVIKPNEQIWVDKNINDKWASYVHSNVYTKSQIINSTPDNDLNFGKSVSINQIGTVAVVSDNNGLFVYEKGSSDNLWAPVNRLEFTGETEFGRIVKLSPDAIWLAVVNNNNKVYFYLRSYTGEYSLEEIVTVPTGPIINVTFTKVGNDYYFAAANNSYNASRGRVYVYKLTDTSWTSLTNLTGTAPNDNFGYDLAFNFAGTYLVVSAPGADTESGKVSVYEFNNDVFATPQILNLPVDTDAERFGESVAISSDGKYIAIAATKKNVNNKFDVGQVYVYNFNNSAYSLIQTINSRRQETGEFFGFNLEFMNNSETLVIFSRNSNATSQVTFDNATTEFDNNSLRFVDRIVDTGLIDVYDRYNTKFVFGETLENTAASFSDYGLVIAVGGNCIISSAIKEKDYVFEEEKLASGQVYSYVKPAKKLSWTLKYEQQDRVDLTKVKKSFLYDKIDSTLIRYLDIVDPIQGKIPGIADQEIKYKTYYDPAIYSSGSGSVNIDTNMAWTDKQVGMLWWDLSRAKFYEYSFGDTIYRSSVWNRLYDTASIDVYEWVSSTLTPAQWNEQADTEAGLTKGISGTTKYGNDVYSVKRRYDSISKTFKNTYYYWVKNKTTIPNIEGRVLSSSNVSKLISDPLSYGYSCLGFTGTNTFNLVNLEKYLQNKHIILNVQYWVNNDRTNNYHSEWKLLSTNRNTVLPYSLESKWFHSLTGKDDNNRPVPDIKLPTKQQYGIEFRPRQSMFVNRFEALKQFIERTNSVLSTKLITDNYNLSNLMKADPIPSTVSALWDTSVDTEEELRFVSTTLIQQAQLSLTISSGKIVAANILASGYGYGKSRVYQVDGDNDPILWYGPNVSIYGTGVGAVLKTIVDNFGRVVNVIVEEQGEGYIASKTSVNVRPFRCLVKNDTDAYGNWSIYEWASNDNRWLRVKTQGYNVANYWNYIDWYDEGYNQFVKIDYLVENTYELITTDIPVGSIVKVKNIGSGGWVLLEKINSLQTIDYTQNYSVVGRQNGSIQFSSKLYNLNVGYDSYLNDTITYDNYPDVELKIILETIRNNILIDDLRVEYLKLFFASVRYAISEQTFIDWAFKTSFVKSQHNVGELKEKVTYNSDNLEFFEEYIKEVKPYRTKVREYVSNYSKLDNSGTAVTDFDLLPVIDASYDVSSLSVRVTDQGLIDTSFAEINTYPWKFWTDEVGFTITDIKIVDGGSGYTTRPVVKIQGVQLQNGIDAKAKAYISNGKVTRIELVNSGTRWIKAPIITLEGGFTPEGSQARAVAIIGNSVVRSNYVKIKFDRTSRTYEVLDLIENETFIGTGSKSEFALKWSPDIAIGNAYVTINGAEVLRDQYSLRTVEATNRGYTSYSGVLVFKNSIAAGSVINVEYKKNFEHLNAIDRINFYYNPQTGQIGKDPAQLMTGIDYGGVNITGLNFEINLGWDSSSWFSDFWDANDPSFEDVIVTVGAVPAYEFRMPYTPEVDQEINVYVSRYNGVNYDRAVRIDDPNFATILQTNANALMKSFVGDGEINVVVLPITANLQENDKVIFRKITSDGSINPFNEDYDTSLSGGTLANNSTGTVVAPNTINGAYSTASGLAPDDIILDGDDFVTPMTSHAPEEIVPGHVVDTLAIKVYHRPSGGAPNIIFKNYIANGSTTTFNIGQYFENQNSIIVKVDNTVLELITDYTIDYQNNLVELTTTPSAGSTVSIVSVGFNSANTLDVDYYVADGATKEYITKAPWLPTVTATVLVNGVVEDYVLFSTDDTYSDVEGQTWRSRVGISFAVPPAAGSIVTYIIDANDITQTASVVKTETVVFDGANQTYTLANVLGESLPYDTNILVKQGQHFLTGPSASYFNLENEQLEYSLKDYKYESLGVVPEDIRVYINSNLLEIGVDYNITFDYTGPVYSMIESTVTLTSAGTGYNVDDVLEVVGGVIGYSGSSAKVVVTNVNGSGAITGFEISGLGQYQTAPEPGFTLIGGSGSGANISANFELVLDPPSIIVKLSPSSYVSDGLLVIVVDAEAEYLVDGQEITFTSSYSAGTEFEIISFYNHSTLAIERTVDKLIPASQLVNGTSEYYELTDKLGGSFTLRNTAISGDYVWVIKNKQLLMNNIDYVLDSDYVTIKLKDYLIPTDVVEILAFTNVIVEDNFGYMQFKDMLNRVHYKRLNRSKSTTLARVLNQFDSDILVEDASVLDNPNPTSFIPGIIEINGERIEYFAKSGNTLSQLRRGTLGTGVPTTHDLGTLVQGLGSSETIPYKDDYTVTTVVSDGVSTTVPLSYIPSVNDIEVFVGGYRLKKPRKNSSTGSYNLGYEIFGKLDVSGNLVHPDYPYSPEGDITLPPEFTVNGLGQLQLATAPASGVKIVVVKKQGRLWNDLGKRIANSNNSICNFITAVESNYPQ